MAEVMQVRIIEATAIKTVLMSQRTAAGTWGPAHQTMSLPSALKWLLNGTANSHSGDFWRLNSLS